MGLVGEDLKVLGVLGVFYAGESVSIRKRALGLIGSSDGFLSCVLVSGAEAFRGVPGGGPWGGHLAHRGLLAEILRVEHQTVAVERRACARKGGARGELRPYDAASDGQPSSAGWWSAARWVERPRRRCSGGDARGRDGLVGMGVK